MFSCEIHTAGCKDTVFLVRHEFALQVSFDVSTGKWTNVYESVPYNINKVKYKLVSETHALNKNKAIFLYR